jgi:hypothetical protein
MGQFTMKLGCVFRPFSLFDRPGLLNSENSTFHLMHIDGDGHLLLIFFFEIIVFPGG